MVRFHAELEPLLVPIDSVKPHHRNYNRGDVEAIKESILTVGMYRPIYVDKATDEILGGNHTWEACKDLGSELIPIIRLDVSDAEAIKVMVGDNHIAALALPDNWELVSLLSELQLNDNLYGTGYTERDVEVLVELNKINSEPLEFAQWPMISFQIPPHMKKAFYKMTKEADTDVDRFELLLRLAGWDGHRD